MRSYVYKSIWFKLGMMIDTIKLYNFNSPLTDLELHSRSQECKKAKNKKQKKTLWQLFDKDFNGFYLSFYLVPIIFKGEDPIRVIFFFFN